MRPAVAACYDASVKHDVVIIDYGAGNLRSVTRAVAKAGFCADVSSDPRALDEARAVIVPGVGAAADTMRNLREKGMIEPLTEFIAAGRPFLGVCMGLQALLSSSDEGGGETCLDIIPGTVRRITGELKVPHMGWNTVRQVSEHAIFDGIPDDAYFYFVHSFYVDPVDPSVVIGETEYGRTIPAVIARDNVIATQFHPEKSSTHGLMFYANFINNARESR